MIYDKIREQLNAARKEKDQDKVLIASTIVGNLDNKAKVVNGQKVVENVEAIKYLKSHLKNLNELIGLQKIEKTSAQELELAFVESFIPPQMTEDDIRGVIRENLFENVGAFMAYMKKNHEGTYDGGLASKIFKEDPVWAFES